MYSSVLEVLALHRGHDDVDLDRVVTDAQQTPGRAGLLAGEAEELQENVIGRASGMSVTLL